MSGTGGYGGGQNFGGGMPGMDNRLASLQALQQGAPQQQSAQLSGMPRMSNPYSAYDTPPPPVMQNQPSGIQMSNPYSVNDAPQAPMNYGGMPASSGPAQQQQLAQQSLLLGNPRFQPMQKPAMPAPQMPQGAPLAPANLPPWAQSMPGQMITSGANDFWQQILDGRYNQYISGGGRPWSG